MVSQSILIYIYIYIYIFLSMKLVPLQKKGHKIVKKKKGQKDAVKHKKLLTVPVNTTHLA